MNKSLKLGSIMFLALLCSCSTALQGGTAQNTATQIYFDTAVTLTADCSDEVLSAAFSLCEQYEKAFSRTKADSEVSLLTGGKRKVSVDMLSVIKKGLYYSELSGGRFDITVAPLSSVWDFKNGVVPTRDEIAEALKNIDYQSVTIEGDTVDTNGKTIDLGAIAKGYVADRLLDFFKEKNVESGIINLGGNVTVFGDRYYTVGIKKPFSKEEISAVLKLKNKSVSTSGIYERYFEKDGELYHHILDTATGFPVDTDLMSVSVIGDTSADCDALGTVCLIYGLDKARALINATEGFEAVFIDKDNKIEFTDGLYEKDGNIQLK